MKTMLVTVDSLFTNFGTYGAVDGARFRNLLLGRQALYQLSYYRIICLPACQPRFTERRSASFYSTFDLRGRIGMNNVNYPRWRGAEILPLSGFTHPIGFEPTLVRLPSLHRVRRLTCLLACKSLSVAYE